MFFHDLRAILLTGQSSHFSCDLASGAIVMMMVVPEPAPASGPHTFPTKDMFPPPRPFVKGAKLYASGSQRGSHFDLSLL